MNRMNDCSTPTIGLNAGLKTALHMLKTTKQKKEKRKSGLG